MIRKLSVTALSVLALAACAEAPIPVEPLAMRLTAVQAFSVASDDTWLVSFKGAIPEHFESTVASLGGQLVFAHERVGIAAVAGLGQEGATALASDKAVASVDPDAYTLVDEPSSIQTEAVADAIAAPLTPNTAFFYPRQWHLRAIGAHTAWAAGILGSPSVRVGILDTGIGYTHADLAGRVDLALSRSFVPSDDALVAALFPGAHPVADLHYHGTHVAATVSSNAMAAAGVTSQVTLVGLKVCNVNGRCPASGTLAAVLYAADQGLDVINLSLGGYFMRRDASAAGGVGPSFLATVNRVFNYAKASGTTIVVSAGNAAIDLDRDGNGYASYCNTSAVVCVSATGPTASSGVNGPWASVDAPAGYTNYGRSAIDVAAPGGTPAASVWAACSRFSLVIPICRTGTFVVGLHGTSMAAPHASGLAALIAGTGVNRSQIEATLQKSADNLGERGTDPYYGKGRINVAAAMGLN